MGAGFDKPADARYYTLRFPRVLKIHEDRSFKDTVSVDELQEMAKRCREVPEDGEREEANWLEKLQRVNPKSDYLVDTSTLSSPNDKQGRMSSKRG